MYSVLFIEFVLYISCTIALFCFIYSFLPDKFFKADTGFFREKWKEISDKIACRISAFWLLIFLLGCVAKVLDLLEGV